MVVYKPDHQQIGILNHTLGRALRAQSRHEEAARHFTKAAQILTAAFDAQHIFVAIARMDLGMELTVIGRYADAERELLATYGQYGKTGTQSDGIAAECSKSHAFLYATWERSHPGLGYAERATMWQRSLGNYDPRNDKAMSRN